MDQRKKTSTSRSSSRSKRSNMNLSDLRLAPLSTKYAQPPRVDNVTSSPKSPEVSFARSHSSYLQGKSAPTTPGILSRSSSRRHLGGGLSRRGSLYDNDVQAGMDSYQYAGVVRDEDGGVRVEVGSGQIPKAKSEAALLVQRNKLAVQGVPLKTQKTKYARIRQDGTMTPRAKAKPKGVEDDWLTRTGAATNALLQESKGQSWIASRESSTSLTHLQDTTSEEDEDDGYEEMAALSARASRRQLAEEELTPVSTRASRWGSRYGSRTASRRTSRRGSIVGGTRTPLAGAGGQDVIAGFFNEEPLALPMEPDFIDADEENEAQDAATLARLTEKSSFGLGSIVDRIMNFNLFKVEEREEVSTEDEAAQPSETEAQAKERMAAENQRKREEKEKLVNRSAQADGEEGAAQGEGGWSDAAWLLSVASKAIF